MRVKIEGPLFDGRAHQAAGDYADHVAREVAGFAGNRVVGEMQAFFKHPRPYYWTLINVEPNPGGYIVKSRIRLVYEHWLAGVGSRNFPVTRFRGYPHWRNARASAQSVVRQVQQRLWGIYKSRMGG